MTRRAILIAGPTASGKSALAVRLAQRHDGVVINADSMQVYRDLEILTARPDAAVIPPASLDVIVVPGVAFDRSGARLGRGGGYYDGFLAGLPGSRPVRVALAFDAQIVEGVPMEAHDQRVHVIVTPTEVIAGAPRGSG